MTGMHPADLLQQRIEALEKEVQTQERELKKSISNAFELLKPANLVRYTIQEITHSPETVEDLSAMAAGIGAGMAARNLVTGNSESIIRKFAGSLLEIGTNNIVSKNYPAIKAYVKEFAQSILKNKN